MKDKIDILIGNKLKDAMNSKRYSYQDVATKIGHLSRGAVSNYFNANRTISIPMLIKFCKCLDLDYKELMDEIANEI